MVQCLDIYREFQSFALLMDRRGDMCGYSSSTLTVPVSLYLGPKFLQGSTPEFLQHITLQ